MARSVLIAGGTGFVGSALCRRLIGQAVFTTVLTRTARPDKGPLHYRAWNPAAVTPELVKEIEESTVLVNLAGRSIAGGRWTESAKKDILESRVSSTKTLVDAMAKAAARPAVLINASAVGFYGTSEQATFDETAPSGGDFLAKVCAAWEAEAQRAQALGVRVVLLRIGVALGKDGGALAKMRLPFRLGLGGPLGDGKQWMSWIHVDDLAALIAWLMDHPEVSGPVNATAPAPATNEEFSRALARALRRPCVLRVPAFVLKLAAGEMSEMLLKGQRALPTVAQSKGFPFKYPGVDRALEASV